MSSAAATEQCRLIVLAGPLCGDVLALSPSEVTIGRDASNEISVADLSLSRRHCALSLIPGRWRIRDLGSSNGTFVNGMQITDHPLADGDRIQAGESVFVLVAQPRTAGAAQVTVTPESRARATT